MKLINKQPNREGYSQFFTTTDNSDKPVEEKEFVFARYVKHFDKVEFDEFIKSLSFETVAWLADAGDDSNEFSVFTPALKKLSIH